MNMKELNDILICNAVVFEYQGKKSGIELEYLDHDKAAYIMWFGDKWKEYHDYDTMINDNLFDGKSFLEIVDAVNIQYQ